MFAEDNPGSWSGREVGPYTLGSFLEDDRYGEIYLVEGDSGIAVKIIHPEIGTQRAQTGNFEADLEAAGGIHHSGLARCASYDMENEPRFVAWDHLDGAVTL